MKNKNLNSEDLKKYASGKLLDKDANRVERTLLEQPLYADAVEGFEAIQNDNIDNKSIQIDLKNRLHERIQTDKTTPKPTKIIPLWQPISIAASVLLLIGVGFYLFNKNIDNQEVSINQNEISKETVPAKADAPEIVFDEKKKEAPYAKPTESANYKSLPPINKDSIDGNAIISKRNQVDEKSESVVLAESPPLTATADNEEKVLKKPVESRSRETKKEDEVTKDKDDAWGIANKPAAPAPTSETVRLGSSNITGVVVDEDKEPMQGVAIYLKGTIKTAKTDEKGRFYIDGLQKGNALIMNFNDMPTQEIIVNNPTIGQIIYSEKLNKYEPKVEKRTDPFYTNNFIEAKPEFGWAMYQDYLKENTKIPQKAIEKGIKGRVTIRFKVNENGEMNDFRVTKSLGFGCDEEAIRVISTGPKWFPAFRYGHKTVSTTSVIVRFE